MFNPATRKQQDQRMDKAARAARRWLQRGFTPHQVADGLWHKAGYTSDVKDGVVRIHGCYNDEYDNWRGKRPFQFYVMRQITADTIERFDSYDATGKEVYAEKPTQLPLIP